VILELGLGVIFGFFIMVIGLLPAISFTIPVEALSIISDIIYGVYYFLPVDFIIMLVSFSIALDLAHMVWKLIKTGKGFIFGGD
jgi:hypothetical protein